MLDMYDFENDIWLCHSFDGKCLNYTAFVRASLDGCLTLLRIISPSLTHCALT